MNKILNEFIKNNQSKLIVTRTRAERFLFSKLPRNMRLSAKIQRPVIVNDHVCFADVYLPKIQVAIEVDGWSHAAKQDKERNLKIFIRSLNEEDFVSDLSCRKFVHLL